MDSLEKWRPCVEGRKFVWLLAPPWHDVPTRQNHFAQRLVRLGAEVLYVENPSAWTSVLKQRRWSELPMLGSSEIEAIEPRLHVMRPGMSFPGMKSSDTIASVNGRLIARKVQQYLREHGWSSYLCWCRVPACLFPLRHLAPERTVYDVTDDYELYERSKRARTAVEERENLLLARADHVFITSPELRKKAAFSDNRPHLAPNGVDCELFAQAQDDGLLHPLMTEIAKPVIGYVGLTSHWMDFDLLEILGRRWPGQVVMVGPIAAEVEARARAIPGIRWIGLVPQPKLPPYLRGFDVCIMPHVVNELRRRSNPLKICEYLATGKPFVSIDLPALEPFREVVDIARDREDFVRLVEANLKARKDTDLIRRRQEMARAFSWDHIFEGVLQQLFPPLRAAA